ncbi:MAG TPA: methyltransferase domain-containing protein [Thermodesulfobacteriota bacterium]|nr:methyltransferase domain-containing protein [Thermodesulfobacteriota bacterium]
MSKFPKKKKGTSGEPKSVGPVPDLETHVRPDWWRSIFNATYLKTDADVVDDQRITKKEVDLFSEVLKLSQQDRVLDLCCGQGRHLLELAKRGFQELDGLDRSHYLIQRAKTQARKEGLNIKFREGDARKLPYPPDTFDVVTLLGNSFGYFETTQDDLRILKEIFRVLKPWGRLLIDVADGEFLKENFQSRSWEWIDKKHFVCRERSLSSDQQRLISREVVTHVEKGVLADQLYAERLYTRDSITKLLKAGGFSDVNIHTSISTDSERNQDLGMMERRIIITAVTRKEWTPIKKKKETVKNVVVTLGDPAKPDPLKPRGVFDEDDLYTIDQMKDALRELEQKSSYSFIYLSNHDTLIQDLIKLREKGKVDYVLNLCDEGFYNDSTKELHVPSLLDILRIPYTGAGPQCLAYCYDKSLVRGIAKEMGIPVPKAFFIKPEDLTFELPFGFPVIVKPNFGDSSFGITQRSVAYSIEELTNAISEIRQEFGYDKPILVEEFLTGKDLSVGIIGNSPESYTVLPVIEEDYSILPEGLPKICGYEAKWLPDSPYWNLRSIPAGLPEETEKFLVECCLKLFERLECRDYSRFDLRLDSEGNPKLLEVNPNPGWVWDGHLAKMASLMGIGYPEMLKMILQAAEQRLKLHEETEPEKNQSVRPKA